MANFVVPKQATIHFNDLSGMWSVKMSEQKQDSNGYQQIIEVIHEITSLAQVFSQLLAFWALFASGEDVEQGTMLGTVGDLSAAVAVPDGMALRETTLFIEPAGFSDEGELDDSVVPYDGEGDDWGATPPP